MCGIAGFFSPNGSQALLQAMGTRIRHRGPDDAGTFCEGPAGLAHARLAILDPSPAGHQPMVDASGEYVLIYNGEIYNHPQLRQALECRFAFRSRSDTETLLYGLIDEGPRFLSKLNGIFALAFYHRPSRSLLLARDPLGVKPLYLYHSGGDWLFASEIKAFLAWPSLDRSLDPAALAGYLSYLWNPGEQTPFRHVRKLPPGHYLEIREGQESLPQRFYRMPFKGRYRQGSAATLGPPTAQHLQKAVERQLLSDRPVGFFLSGGLDSSALLALARERYPQRHWPCYSIREAGGRKEGFAEDIHYARRVARYLGTELREIPAPQDFSPLVDELPYQLDEPLADTAALLVGQICQQARQDGVPVLLNGTGGDDLFSGYRRHRALNLEPLLRLPGGSTALQAVAALFRHFRPGSALARRLGKLARWAPEKPLQRRQGYYQWWPEKAVIQLFAPPYRQELEHFSRLSHFLELLREIPEEQNPLNQMLHWELRAFLPDHNLCYLDKMSMQHGIEGRVPFLDLQVVQWACSLPPSLKMAAGRPKSLLKNAMAPYLPHEVVRRPKTGFGRSIRQWLLDNPHYLAHALRREVLDHWGLFDPAAVGQLLQAHRRGHAEAAEPLLSLLMIHSWLRHFAD